jgi:hypothetical protein
MTTPDPRRPGVMSPAQRAWAAEALDEHWAAPEGREDLHDGGTHLLDLVAAVDHLARGLRHDFTPWDALDEALHWWLNEQASHPGGAVDEPDIATHDEDPLCAHMAQALELVASNPDATLADVLQQAIRHWATTMAERFNNGYHWPHPAPRRGFPPAAVGQ